MVVMEREDGPMTVAFEPGPDGRLAGIITDGDLRRLMDSARDEEQRGPRVTGLNENLAREVLELHTLGVEGGYTQIKEHVRRVRPPPRPAPMSATAASSDKDRARSTSSGFCQPASCTK